MKKHPVDDLFKRKLEGMQRTPSENAWLKIQEKQQPAKHRPVVWGWYAAAGVAAAVMGGYLVWQNQQGVAPGMDAQKVVAEAKMAPESSANVASVDSIFTPLEKSNAQTDEQNVPVEKLAAIEKTGSGLSGNTATGLKNPTNAGNNSEPQVAKAPAHKADSKTPVAEPASMHSAPELAVIERPSIPVHSIQPEPAINPVAQGTKTLPDEPAVNRVNKPEPEPTRTIVVAVETGDNESEDKPRNTRFARVFRQLKNARAGERVDWEEVGFNPKNLVARVDDRLRGKDERSNERDHPKNKTKL